MAYESFKEKVRALVSKSGLDINNVLFREDTEGNGEYRAYCDGVTIIGYPSRLKMTVKWGSGHLAMTAV